MYSVALSILILAQAPAASGPSDTTAPATAPAAPAPVAAPVSAPTTGWVLDSAPAATTQPASAAAQVAAATTQPTPGPTTGPTMQAATAAPPAAATSQPAEQPSGFAKLIANFPTWFLFVPLLIVWLFMSSRTRRNQDKAAKERLNSVKRGDRVQTIGGILGNVVQTDEKRILVKVDESNNTKIWFARDAIRGVIEEDKSEAKGGK